MADRVDGRVKYNTLHIGEEFWSWGVLYKKNSETEMEEVGTGKKSEVTGEVVLNDCVVKSGEFLVTPTRKEYQNGR